MKRTAKPERPNFDPAVEAMITAMTAINLRAHLSKAGVPEPLRRIIAHLADSAKYIAFLMGVVKRTHTGTNNTFNEAQTHLDVAADKILLDRLARETSFGIAEFASEEQGKIVLLRESSEEFSITVDPLDGSSRIRVNGAVGTIIGIHRRPIIGGKPGRETLVAAMYTVYGPLTALVYTAAKGVHEFVLDQSGNFILCQENIVIKERGSIYSPGGQRTEWPRAHADFIAYLEARHYKLRYSGAFVADWHQLLLDGGGIFTYPALKKDPDGKLRLLFEAQPMAMIAEQAGGRATDGRTNILDLTARSLEQRTPLYIGSRHEVKEAGEFLARSTGGGRAKVAPAGGIMEA